MVLTKNKKTVAITGATGLVGAWVNHELSNRGHRTLCIGRRSDSDFFCDFTKPDSFTNLQLKDVDVLIHCAGVVDEDFLGGKVNPFLHAVQGTEALVRVAMNYNIRKIIVISTIHVYGLLQNDIDELTSVNPLSEYSLAHFCAEQIVRRAALTGAFQGVILRPCTICGIPIFPDKFDRWQLIPYDFPLSAVRSQKISLRSSGLQKRNFIDIRDLVNIIDNILRKKNRENWRILNPTGVTTMSVLSFAQKTAQLYFEKTGKVCKISAPPSNGSKIPESSTVFRTLYSDSRGVMDIDDYISDAIDFFIKKNH